jgi:hypothetical protein
MTTYLAAQRSVFKEVRVTTHPNPKAAAAFLESYPSEWTGYVIADENDPDLSGPGLVMLYNALARGLPGHQDVKKFESRGAGKRRIWAVLTQAHEHKPHETAVPAPAVETGDTKEAVNQDPGRGHEDQEIEAMASKKKTKKPAKPAGEKKSRGKGKAAGKVADFRPVREGTDRHKVLKMMNGSNTAEQIAAELGMNSKKVGTIVFCMSRDNGIGYEFGAKGQLKALFPGEKTLKDAVKKPAAE